MHCTLKNLLTLAPLASLAVLTNAASHKADYGMGVAGLLWPTDRDFVDDSDTIAPCGSSAGVGSRTKFPTCEFAPLIATEVDTTETRSANKLTSGGFYRSRGPRPILRHQDCHLLQGR